MVVADLLLNSVPVVVDLLDGSSLTLFLLAANLLELLGVFVLIFESWSILSYRGQELLQTDLVHCRLGL